MSSFDYSNMNIMSVPGAKEVPLNRTTCSGGTSSDCISFDSDKYKELCEKYNISEEELQKLLNECQNNGIDVFALTPEEITKQLEEIRKTAKENVQDTGNEEVSERQEECIGDYNSIEFANLSNDEKLKVLIQELAKNEFLYGDSENKKTIEDWNALSDEEKNKYIEQYKPHLEEKITKIYNLISNDKTDDFDVIKSKILDYADSESLNKAYTIIMAIDHQKLGIEDLIDSKKITKEQTEEWVHDYLTAQENNTLTDNQKKYLDESRELSKAVIHYAKNHDVESQYAKHDDVGNFTISEMRNYAKSKGTTVDMMQIEYFLDKAKLSEDDKKVIEILLNTTGEERDKKLKEAGVGENIKEVFQKIKSSSLENNYKDRLIKMINGKVAFNEISADENSATLKEINENEKISNLFNSKIESQEIKSSTLYKVFNENYGSLDPEQYAKKVIDLLGGLKAQKNDGTNNSEIAFEFYAKVMEGATDEQKDALIKELKASLYNTSNVNNLNSKQTEDLSVEVNKKNDLYTAVSMFETIDDKHFEHTGALAQSENLDFGKLSVDRNNKVKDADIQRRYLKNYENAISEVRAYGAENSYKLLEANQVFGLETFIKGDKMATDAANNSGVVAKMAVKNQTEAMNSIKNSIEDLWKGDDAISRLNNLSDQIKDCDSSNQLDMHKSFMSSEYSEVVEHTAGNIKNYDPSVQGQAMDAVYQTGNQKAIEAGYSGLVEKYSNAQELPPGVKDILAQETTRAILESAPQDAVKEFLDKFKSGSLSYSDIQKLPASQKREYYMQLFKQARPEEKLQLIKKVPNGTMKKSMLKMIAVISPTFFDYMITSDADFAKNIYEMNLNESINNKIKHIANQKGVSQNDFAEIKKDIEEKSYPPTAKTLTRSGMTIPKGFNSKEIFPKDKNGYLLG